jgi:hypothetical protein
MRFTRTLLSVFLISTAYAQRPPAFAKTDRVVTVEQWGRGEATVWAVQPDRIVVYKIFDTAEPDQKLAEIPIKREDADRIRNAVDAIPKELRGQVYLPRDVYDGVMLRLSFTTDGHYTSDRIEVQNLWFQWLGQSIEAISATMPAERRIPFKETVERQALRANWPTKSISIDEYYKQPKPPLPTPTSGTSAVGAPLAPPSSTAGR